ncbi:MAG: zinc dependent phospholipase C family protein [Gammaproteobacteria bacterium]|nr:zinc dependent phospholipase C family protein [Gammaproteobacteria bacterium]
MWRGHAARMNPAASINPNRTALLWSVPVVLFAGDALAWGLITHVYFAQLLVWAVPLLDPALRRAVRRYPQRLMAGACLPDLALVGSTARTRAFDTSHRWDTAHALLEAAHDDETRACAVGAMSHLWVDIIAHNHFVPAHEHLWWNVPMLTHAASEWAMDRHIARHLFRPPAALLGADDWLVDYVACNFGCTPAASRRAIKQLAGAESTLRHSRLPNVLHGMGRLFDRKLPARFDYYIQEVTTRLPQINRVFAGEAPAWLADCPPVAVSRKRIAAHAPELVACRMPLPGDLFEVETPPGLSEAA